MSASPVVDLVTFRQRARVVREAAAPAPAAPASVTVLRSAPPLSAVGPASPFGPVMAFGLRPRPDGPALPPAPPLLVTAPPAAGLPPAADPQDGAAAPSRPPLTVVASAYSRSPSVTSALAERAHRPLDGRGALRAPRR